MGLPDRGCPLVSLSRVPCENKAVVRPLSAVPKKNEVRPARHNVSVASLVCSIEVQRDGSRM
jgi:hypothetical protein